MSERIWNFSAGPAVLPEAVLKKAQAALWDLDGTGIGVMEHSHRGKPFMKVYDKAERLVRELAGVGDEHAVLFLQGGASTQFFMIPMNLLAAGQTADFVHTGEWSKRAIAEAGKFGRAHVVASSEDENFSYLPSPASFRWSDKPVYAHVTSNNTIFGTQWASIPEPPPGVPLVCDASSDYFSRPIDVARYGILYGGAQKNLGPSGVTLVIARKDLIERGPRDLPTMLQYRTHADNQSMYNTPPTFAIYVLAEVLDWIRAEGGLAAVAEKNQAKAKVLYDFLDASRAFRATARPGSRSLMNVTFRGPSEALEDAFCKQAEAAGFSGLKGHRSVGGMRASIYNAFPAAGVDALVAFMDRFEQANR